MEFFASDISHSKWRAHTDDLESLAALARENEFMELKWKHGEHMTFAQEEYAYYMQMKEKSQKKELTDTLNLSVDAMELLQLLHFAKKVLKVWWLSFSFSLVLLIFSDCVRAIFGR